MFFSVTAFWNNLQFLHGTVTNGLVTDCRVSNSAQCTWRRLVSETERVCMDIRNHHSIHVLLHITQNMEQKR